MTVTTPPRRPETEQDRDLEQRVAVLEALIEEARRRARRRRRIWPPMDQLTLIRSLATLALLSLALVAAASVGAAPPPPPPPKFWSVSHCERVLHVQGDDVGITADGYRFHVGLRACVGTGGPRACEWTSDHGSRLYSQFRVFSRARYIGGIVRSWTLATRGGIGLVAIRRRGGDQYVGWPADFYMSPASVELLAPNASPARFRSIVAPLVARLTQQENATGCAGG